MAKAVWFISYKLKEGSSIEGFLTASKQTNKEVLSKKKGFISWQVLRDGDTWVDFVTWETMEDAVAAEKSDEPNPIADHFYSFLDYNSMQMKSYTIENEHGK